MPRTFLRWCIQFRDILSQKEKDRESVTVRVSNNIHSKGPETAQFFCCKLVWTKYFLCQYLLIAMMNSRARHKSLKVNLIFGCMCIVIFSTSESLVTRSNMNSPCSRCKKIPLNPLELRIEEIKVSNSKLTDNQEFCELRTSNKFLLSKNLLTKTLKGYFIFQASMNHLGCLTKRNVVDSISDISFVYHLKNKQLDKKGRFLLGGKGFSQWALKKKWFAFNNHHSYGCGIGFLKKLNFFAHTTLPTTLAANQTAIGLFLAYLPIHSDVDELFSENTSPNCQNVSLNI